MGDDVDSKESRAALEQQRDEVRVAAVDVIDATEAVLRGRRTNPSGRYLSCQSGGIDYVKNVRYSYSARVDAGLTPPERPFVGWIAPRIDEAGFGVEALPEERGASVLRATRDDLTVTVTERASAGDFVLLRIEGPCVDIAKDDSDYWLTYDDNEPL